MNDLHAETDLLPLYGKVLRLPPLLDVVYNMHQLTVFIWGVGTRR